MSAPVVLVTGTSSGIGLATVVALLDRGATVVATVRPGRAQPLLDAVDGRAVDVRELDVTDAVAAAALVDAVAVDHGRLDVLVNNAGRGQVGTLTQLDDAQLRETFETNFFAVATLTRAALPHLERSRGRVVTVTSVGGAVGQPFNDAYCAAKFAVEGLLQSLAPVAAGLGVGVHVVEPGPVATSFVDNVGRAQDSQEGRIAQMFAAYTQRTSGVFDNAQPAAEVAAVVVTTALDADQPFRVQTSDGARAFAGLSLADVDGARVLGATTGWIA